MIERQNIMSLLGSDKNKYHSCIITSYSFDFLFFEQRILPLLRHAGIININLIVDAGMLQQQLEFKTSKLTSGKKSYSLIPVEMNGAFHPKIFLATGKKKGFLSIGSGNITGSGMSSNEEIWSSFFLSDNNDHTLPIFFAAATYLSKLYTNAYATNVEKIQWIRENSPWYSALDKLNYNGEGIVHKDCSFQFISTNADNSIFRTLIGILPEGPICIKILSPFYNPDGKLIKNLFNELKPEKVHCVVDPEYGTVPYKFENQNDVQFSDWNNIKKMDKYQNARIHAKAFQFEYEKSTYFLFGSANATEEAFGNMVENSKNSETCILIKSNIKIDFFSELQIDIPTNGNYNLADYAHNTIQKPDLKKNYIYPVKIKHAEIESGNLTIYLTKNADIYNAIVKVFDPEDNILYSGSPITLLEENSENIGDDNIEVFKVALFQDDYRISNYCFIHHCAELKRTNPNTSLVRFNELLNNEFISDVEMNELLEYAQYKPVQKYKGHALITSKSTSENNDEDSSEILTEEDFNRSAGYINRGSSHAHSTQIELLEEFLNNLIFGRSKKAEDLNESKETEAMRAGDRGIDEDNFSVGPDQIITGEKDSFLLKHKINSIFEKIVKGYLHLKEDISKSIYKNQSSDITVNIEDIQGILIGLHLYLGKRYDHFSENRCLLRIEMTKGKIITQKNVFNHDAKLKKGLIDFEKDFQLIKLESQTGNTLNQITYTAKESISQMIRENFLHYEGIKLLYMDTTPSQNVIHNFIDTITWPESEKYSGAENMVIHGLGSFLLMLMGGEEPYQGKDQQKWLVYKERFFYKSILTLLTYKWKDKTKPTRNIMMLNIFHLLLPSQKNNNEIIEYLASAFNKISKDVPLSEPNVEEFNALLSKYRTWLEKFKTSDPSIKKPTESVSTGTYIYHSKIGFSILRNHMDHHLLHVESPLGLMNKKTKVFGFSDFFGGSKLTVFE